MRLQVILDELINISKGEPLFPGDTLSHSSANECVNRGWAKRNDNWDFVMTTEGHEILQSKGWVQ